MRRKLHLHIGLPKTGSTFIQTTLLYNQTFLKSVGVLYPNQRMDKKGSHYLWENVFAADPQQSVAELNQLCDENGVDQVLLSAENFVTFLAFDERAPAAAEVWKAAFDVSLVLYLRRQDEFLESFYAQSMRAGEPDDIESFSVNPIFDYKSICETIADLNFSRFEVTPHRFARADPMASLDPVADLAGFDRSGLRRNPNETSNLRASRRLVLFLAALDKSQAPSMGPVLRALESERPVADDGGKCLAAPAFRRRFWETHLAGNEALCDRFGDDALRAALCEYEDVEPDWAAPAPVTEAELQAATRIVDRVAWRRRALLRARALFGIRR